MKSLQQIHSLSYIVISHDLAVVRYLADRIGVMYLGKLMEIAPAQTLYEYAAHPYTRGLIDTIPVPDPVASRAKARQRDPRGAPLCDLPALGLSLSHPVPVRRGDLRTARAAAARLRGGPLGGLSLPAPDATCERVRRRRPRLRVSRTGAAQRRWSRTSSASLRASPMKLMATTTSTIQSPAGTMSHQ